MTTMQFTVTTAGKNAAWNASNTGASINITHIQFGSGNKVPAGNEVALLAPQQKATVAAGYKVSSTQIRMSAMFTGVQAYSISEVGLWIGDPAAGGVLFGYWSQATGAVGSKSAGVDFLFTHDMILDASIPPGSVTVTVDSAQSALIAAHESAANPHPQYVLQSAAPSILNAYMLVYDQKDTGVDGGTSIAGNDHVRDLNTVVVNNIAGASLSANKITLPAGTYKVHAMTGATDTVSQKATLFNVTDNIVQVHGQSQWAVNTEVATINSPIFGYFTIAAAKEFQLRLWTSDGRLTNGLGIAVSRGPEIYSMIEFTKVG